MKNIITPKTLFRRMARGPQIEASGPFWDAYQAIVNGDDEAAQQALNAAYTSDKNQDESPRRVAMLDALAHGLPLYATELTWEELLAASGTSDVLHDLVMQGRLRPIHAAHLEIELSPRIFPMIDTDLRIIQAQALTALYEMEAETLNSANIGGCHLGTWLSERQDRAQYYFSTIQTARRIATLTC
ncbi:hypothetical protein [Ruficoccus sp. ZRK36]|uniref:hypothetical protein n=1 Tax=Ruficoccus sp. ZRK36 TaxID=2866311 RepID=UPI001C73394B|nr:hypothetical protein [Ruficoccus sp. ZRK36]QYY34799.1 hypothetical protein K0V07_10860 [Ruficoccus sp. ZRK36]QYY37293.1 hypothetical protein K0V07_07360 [Ruficoccus sp. ZRK36]